MSWGGSEKNRWFQLNFLISMLWSSSGESWTYKKYDWLISDFVIFAAASAYLERSPQPSENQSAVSRYRKWCLGWTKKNWWEWNLNFWLWIDMPLLSHVALMLASPYFVIFLLQMKYSMMFQVLFSVTSFCSFSSCMTWPHIILVTENTPCMLQTFLMQRDSPSFC